MKQNRRAFTLIEILVVLGIIMLLAAILFPAFSRMQERSAQANCASNLKQIHAAVMMYNNDYKRYPASLAHLLPTSDTAASGNLADYTTTPASQSVNPKSTELFKGGLDALVCFDDDTEAAVPRASYGDISNGAMSGTTFAGPAKEDDPGRYVWNYWGYDASGWAILTETDAAALPAAQRVNPASAYNRRDNPINYALSNRYAPSSTVITHCVFHRLQTSNDLAGPTDLYNDADDSRNTRDIVLRLDGSAKLLDVSAWKDQNKWVVQTK